MRSWMRSIGPSEEERTGRVDRGTGVRKIVQRLAFLVSLWWPERHRLLPQLPWRLHPRTPKSTSASSTGAGAE